MKTTLLILILMCNALCYGQYECDSGYMYMPTLETSGLIIHADTCLPDSLFHRLLKEYNKSICAESSMGSMDYNEGGLSYSRTYKWDDERGCIETEKFMVRRKKKWYSITKEQYTYLFNKQK